MTVEVIPAVNLWQLEMPQAFWIFLYKMATRGHFVFPIDAKNHRVLVIWDLNGHGEYEFDRCICDKVMACTSVGMRRRRRRRRNQHNINEIFGNIINIKAFIYALIHMQYNINISGHMKQKPASNVFLFAIDLLII